MAGGMECHQFGFERLFVGIDSCETAISRF
jgi:hypothetical protein